MTSSFEPLALVDCRLIRHGSCIQHFQIAARTQEKIIRYSRLFLVSEDDDAPPTAQFFPQHVPRSFMTPLRCDRSFSER